MLIDTAVRNAKPKYKPCKIIDSDGLYLRVKFTGKYWRMDCRFACKRKALAIGIYLAVSLIEARRILEDARKLLAEGVDPAIVKAINKQTRQYAAENTFKAIAIEWHTKTSSTWAKSTAHNIKQYQSPLEFERVFYRKTA